MMIVKELIEKLKEFPEDMEVMNDMYMEIDNVRYGVWVHSNYPYNKPDRQVVIIE